jgi:hypothetical protein
MCGFHEPSQSGSAASRDHAAARLGSFAGDAEADALGVAAVAFGAAEDSLATGAAAAAPGAGGAVAGAAGWHEATAIKRASGAPRRRRTFMLPASTDALDASARAYPGTLSFSNTRD